MDQKYIRDTDFELFLRITKNDDEDEEKLRSIIMKNMKKYNIKSVMVTIFYMMRYQLITKEKMDYFCKGKDCIFLHSINDDLQSFFEDLQLGKEPNKNTSTYFLPKLTDEEMKLVDRQDTSFLKTISRRKDVEEAEMNLSDSNSKFVEGRSGRTTFTIES